MKLKPSFLSLFLMVCSLLFSDQIGAEIKPFQNPYSGLNLTYCYNFETLQTLQNLPLPRHLMSHQELNDLLKEVDKIISESDLPKLIKNTLFPAYLANAQNDFATISREIAGELRGSLAPVTLWTLQLFVPTAEISSINLEAFDPFSSGLAAVVVAKSAKRWEEEMRQLHDYPIKQGKDLWEPTSPGYSGLMSGSSKTWLITSSKAFIAPTLPRDPEYLMSQSQEVIQAQANLNPDKESAIYFWAGLKSPNSDKWDRILDDYAAKKVVPLEKRLFSRALLLSALADSNATVFNAKYTYWIQRPSQKNPNIVPFIPVPNHPSYPAAHSTDGATAATILSFLFPENRNEWEELAEECGLSRIWAGIHYPIDHQEGVRLGRKVGQAVLENQKMRREQCLLQTRNAAMGLQR